MVDHIKRFRRSLTDIPIPADAVNRSSDSDVNSPLLFVLLVNRYLGESLEIYNWGPVTWKFSALNTCLANASASIGVFMLSLFIIRYRYANASRENIAVRSKKT